MFKQFVPLLLSATILSGLSITSCKDKTTQKEDKPGSGLTDSVMKGVNIADVRISSQQDAITLTGKVSTNDDNVAKLYPMISGNISGIKVMLGDYVQAGTPLALIRSSEMAGFSNDLTGAETNLRMAETNLSKTKEMYKSGLATTADSLNAAMTYEQAKAALTRSKQVLSINGGSTKGDYIVKAPLSGFIVEKNVTNNMSIRADNGNTLFTISDLKNVWIWANVYESDIDKVHVGDSAQVETLSYRGKIFYGKVDKIMNVLDPTNKVMKVRIVLSNDKYLLKPEMFTSITITTQLPEKALTIPSSALIFDHSQYYVVVYKSASDIMITPVQLIGTVGNNTYIASGLQAGQKVIASEALQVYDQLNN